MTDRDAGRLDRELIELLNELRVMLPGVQVLFAFLLTVPFTGRFELLSGVQRLVYVTAFGSTALASILLIAPSVHHRLRWRQHDKEHLLRTANRLAIAGTILLAVSIGSAVFLVTHVLYGSVTASATTAIVGAATTWLWFGVPLARERD